MEGEELDEEPMSEDNEPEEGEEEEVEEEEVKEEEKEEEEDENAPPKKEYTFLTENDYQKRRTYQCYRKHSSLETMALSA